MVPNNMKPLALTRWSTGRSGRGWPHETALLQPGRDLWVGVASGIFPAPGRGRLSFGSNPDGTMLG